jgi:hypothetical protein
VVTEVTHEAHVIELYNHSQGTLGGAFGPSHRLPSAQATTGTRENQANYSAAAL